MNTSTDVVKSGTVLPAETPDEQGETSMVPHTAKPVVTAARATTVLPSKTDTVAVPMQRWSAEIGEMVGALAKAQSKFARIFKKKTAKIQAKRDGGASYNYQYEDIADVLDAIMGPLNANGLTLMQFPSTSPNFNSVTVLTVLAHKSGQYVRNELTVGCNSSAPQDIGSAVKYARRYGAEALLSLAAFMPGTAPERDGDDDGARATEAVRRTEPARPAAPQPSLGQKITGVRKVANGAWIRGSSTGECFTAIPELIKAAEDACAKEVQVTLVCEERTSGDKKYKALLEIER